MARRKACSETLDRAAFWVSLALVAGLLAGADAALAVPVWQRWDRQLTVGLDYQNGGGNPYRDLQLAVRFTGPGPTLTSYGFWDGGNTFRVRTAFPAAGTWSWSVLSCSGLNGKNSQGQIVACGADTTLMSQGGTVSVDANNRPDNLLYAKGYLAAAGSSLVYAGDSGTRFYWQGDTAWPALSLEGQARLRQPGRVPGEVTATWRDYVDDRASRGFTVLQVGLAIAWQGRFTEPLKPGCPQSAKLVEFGEAATVTFPGPETFAFDQGAPPAGQPACTEAVPNRCSRWHAEF